MNFVCADRHVYGTGINYKIFFRYTSVHGMRAVCSERTIEISLPSNGSYKFLLICFLTNIPRYTIRVVHYPYTYSQSDKNIHTLVYMQLTRQQVEKIVDTFFLLLPNTEQDAFRGLLSQDNALRTANLGWSICCIVLPSRNSWFHSCTNILTSVAYMGKNKRTFATSGKGRIRRLFNSNSTISNGSIWLGNFFQQ